MRDSNASLIVAAILLMSLGAFLHWLYQRTENPVPDVPQPIEASEYEGVSAPDSVRVVFQHDTVWQDRIKTVVRYLPGDTVVKDSVVYKWLPGLKPYYESSKYLADDYVVGRVTAFAVAPVDSFAYHLRVDHRAWYDEQMRPSVKLQLRESRLWGLKWGGGIGLAAGILIGRGL